MAKFQAFFDESGKFKDKKRVVSFCGFCSPPAKVLAFEDAWNVLLRHYGLSCLTMKRALRRKIPFSRNEPAKERDERHAVLSRFVKCIREHFELGVAIAVDVDAYEKWPSRAKRKIGGSDDPHYLAFMTGAGGCANYVSEHDCLNLVCDDEQATAINCYKFYERMRVLDPKIKAKFTAISFADDDKFPSLQAADLFASLVRLECLRQLDQEYYEYMHLFQELIAPSPTMKWVVRLYGSDIFHYLDQKWAKQR